jgi:threonine synthase
MSFATVLRCKECEREYELGAIYVCEFCFGPLEVSYDYERVRRSMTREKIASRPENLWRYRELLPLVGEPTDGFHSGFTPLQAAPNLARELGVKDVWVKNDGMNYPTLSYKDRVVPVALSRAKELGFKIVGCATTGNLGNAVAAHSAKAGMKCLIFVPAGQEMGKLIGSLVYEPLLVVVEGTYDEVNRLCAEITARYPWAFVNVNLRPYYTEGAKTCGFEIAEQLGWRAPDNIVIPLAGGTLLPKIWKGLKELEQLGLLGEPVKTKIYAAQASACAPVIAALHEGSEIIKPVKPRTDPPPVDSSLRIGNPAEGLGALNTIRESGGWGEAAADEEIIEGIKLLARTEGLFTETAGGVTVAVARKLVRQGRISPDESLVIAVTGNGLKTQEAVASGLAPAVHIKPSLEAFERNVPAIVGD